MKRQARKVQMTKSFKTRISKGIKSEREAVIQSSQDIKGSQKKH